MKKIKYLLSALLTFFIGVLSTNAADITTYISGANAVNPKEEFTVTIGINGASNIYGLSAAFSYDAEKLDYISSDLGARATNKSGKIIVAWYSDDNTDKTKAEFSFKTKAEGTTEFSVKIDGGFADKNVVKPDAYDVTTYGKATLEIKAPDVEDETQNPETPSIEDDKEDETQNPETPSIEDDKEGETQNPEKPSTEDNKQNETNKKPTVIPHAGIGENLFVGIVALIIITTFAYIKMRIYKDI